MNQSSVQNILIVKLRTLGDVLTTFPLLRALKELYPQAKLTMIADDAYHDLLEPNPRLDACWVHPAGELKRRGSLFAVRQQLACIRRIRRQKFDLYIDLYGSMRTAQWGWLGGIPRRFGFALRGRKYFYTHPVQAAYRYVVDLNLQFAKLLGWQGSDRSMEFFITPDDEAQATGQLAAQGGNPNQPYIVVSPGGGWPLKLWGAEKFGAVIQAVVAATGCQVVLSGSQAEAALVRQCARASGGKVVSLLGLPLRQVAAVIKQSRLFIGNDSGPKYFAESFQVPTLICYGPTCFENNNPKTPINRVMTHQVDCRPCHSERCRQERRSCLDDLLVEDVVPVALDLYQRSAT